MRVLSINIAKAQKVEYQGRWIETGIFKSPILGTVPVERDGFDGDVQVDRKNHGGRDKAVYAYTQENYRHWETLHGVHEYPHGQFGENLTVMGMPDDGIHIGDIFTVGQSVMQITQPRVPCFKLGIKFGNPRFVADFLVSGRTGFYLRVLEEGLVQPGDAIILRVADPLRVSISDAMHAWISGPAQLEWIEKVLAINALSAAWRNDLTKRLKKNL
jgi:MOSC domain-containing protein YiiM